VTAVADDLAGVAAVVVVRVRHRANNPLHREPPVVVIAVACQLDRLEVLEQRGPVVPGHGIGAVDDVVAAERRHGDRPRVVQAELHSAGWVPLLICLGLFVAFLTQLAPRLVPQRALVRIDCRGPPLL